MKTVDELVALSDSCESGLNIVRICTYTASELKALANCLVKLTPDSRVVEIGTFAGRSASLLFQLQKDLNLDIHLIDNCMWHPEASGAAFNKMIATHFPGIPFDFHRMTSQSLGQSWNHAINFLHVDGHHDLEFVWADCEMWLPHVVSGGMVAFHDSDDAGVKKALDHFVTPTWEHLETVERVTTWRKP